MFIEIQMYGWTDPHNEQSVAVQWKIVYKKIMKMLRWTFADTNISKSNTVFAIGLYLNQLYGFVHSVVTYQTIFLTALG